MILITWKNTDNMLSEKIQRIKLHIHTLGAQRKKKNKKIGSK